MYRRRGPRSHPGLISLGWGLISLSLLLYNSRGQCRLCLCGLLLRVSICSPGGACIVSLRGTKSDPGPVTMTSVGTNHGCGPIVRRGQSRAREYRAKASSGSGLLCAQGRGGLGLGSACSGHGGDDSGRLLAQRQHRLRARVTQRRVAGLRARSTGHGCTTL